MPAMLQQVAFPSGTVNYYFNSAFSALWDVYDMQQVIVITDEHIAALYPDILSSIQFISVPAGEVSKDMNTITHLATKLVDMGATRHTLLIGLGGGMITDLTGFLASIFMRGIRFGFVPTTLLAMTDAAIGGKNGVNMGLYKNMLGTVRQPEFILYDPAFLRSLPDAEWSNGFAEIIKYGCIFDAELLDELHTHSLQYYQEKPDALQSVINRCVAWKNKTVMEDEHEKHARKLLNFGHTAGHAIEKVYALPHGAAVAIGMVIACHLSEQEIGLNNTTTQQLVATLKQYGLPTHCNFEVHDVMNVLKADKKRNNNTIDYILLKQKGAATIAPLSIALIEQVLTTYESTHRAGSN